MTDKCHDHHIGGTTKGHLREAMDHVKSEHKETMYDANRQESKSREERMRDKDDD